MTRIIDGRPHVQLPPKLQASLDAAKGRMNRTKINKTLVTLQALVKGPYEEYRRNIAAGMTPRKAHKIYKAATNSAAVRKAEDDHYVACGWRMKSQFKG